MAKCDRDRWVNEWPVTDGWACADCGHAGPPLKEAEEFLLERLEVLETRLEKVEQYRLHCAIIRVEPSTAGLSKALGDA